MDSPAANDFIVRDIGTIPGHFRWAFLHPELRFRIPDPKGLKFVVDFIVPMVTFKDTGPVLVRCAVNGTELGSIRCTHAGDYHFERRLPEGLVRPNEMASVTFEASPRWIAAADGNQLSFLLVGTGFVSQ